MQHTNSERGSDGRFSQSEAPKAKRIDVWLQPQTIELLDTLTKQWGVGRGKVIDQLLTRGPVPPQSWTEVSETNEPTAVGPPESPPEPSPVGFVSDWGVLPRNASKRQWIAVNVTLNPDLTRSPFGAENLLDQTLRTVAAIRKEDVNIGKSCLPGAMPQFRFLMNVKTATPFTAGYDIPAAAIEMAVQYVHKVHPQQKPEPTTVGRSVPAEGFPGPQNSKLWVSVRARFTPEGKLRGLTHDNGEGFGSANREQPCTARSYRNEKWPLFSAGEDKTNAGLVVGSVVTFALNIKDGSIWANVLNVSPEVAKAAWDEYQKATQNTSC